MANFLHIILFCIILNDGYGYNLYYGEVIAAPSRVGLQVKISWQGLIH